MGFMILLWIAVVVAIVFVIRHLVGRPWIHGPYGPPPWHWHGPSTQGPQQGKSEALRILEERYARGDIDREEFMKRKADIT